MDDGIIIRYIETTGRCNYNCPICVERVRNFDMDMDDFYKVVDTNIDILRNQRVWVDFSGEPLLDKLFFERLEYLHKNNIITQMSTNGFLLDEKISQKLAKSGIDYVVVSVATLSREKYKVIRGIDALPQVIENTLHFKHIIDECGAKTQVQAVTIDTGGESECQRFIDYFHPHGIHVAVHNFTTRANDSRLQYKTKHKCLPKRGACQHLLQNLIILNNLNVITCCADMCGKNVLGNLKNYDYSIDKLLKTGVLDRLIEKQEKQIYTEICKKCNDWMYYQENSTEEYVTMYPVG